MTLATGDHMRRHPVTSDESRNRIASLSHRDRSLKEQPDFHKDATISMSVFSQMDADRPAPTITTGFFTPGQGRYIHPIRQRTLTPAEAARLQSFSDTHRFQLQSPEPPSSAELTKCIGDAFPIPLGPGRFEQ